MGGISGFITAIAPLAGERYALTVTDPSGAGNSLLILELTSTGALARSDDRLR